MRFESLPSIPLDTVNLSLLRETVLAAVTQCELSARSPSAGPRTTQLGGFFQSIATRLATLASAQGNGSVGPGRPLSRFLFGGISGKKVVFWGDSTTEIALLLWEGINQAVLPGGDWAGVVPVNRGFNGQTMQGALNGIQTIYDDNPQLVVLCFGINDVRIGGVDAIELASRLREAVTRLQANLPNCDIVLWTPNSLLTTDEDGYGWMVPLSAAQEYTDVMWNAYESLKGEFKNVLHLDKQAIFGRTALPSHPLMYDTLHPNNDGNVASFLQLVPYLTPDPIGIDQTASAAAWAANPDKPWTLYPRALEDTRYCELVRRITFSVYMELDPNVLVYFGRHFGDEAPLLPSVVQDGDFIWTPEKGVYTVDPQVGRAAVGENGVQMYSIPKADFPVIPELGHGRIYRRLPA
ncbi:SGNH/GDSL hydrolase family protein [Variovorax sp. GT1P44]|uniref:SGNH/GDSL hydrolase family protein n=1 Tax=Variovorax sp. GT1P44 TaxID=3443742 RepID=UPI003F48CE9C